MKFASKTRDFVLKTRDCVSKTRNFVSKVMEFAERRRGVRGGAGGVAGRGECAGEIEKEGAGRRRQGAPARLEGRGGGRGGGGGAGIKTIEPQSNHIRSQLSVRNCGNCGVCLLKKNFAAASRRSVKGNP